VFSILDAGSLLNLIAIGHNQIRPHLLIILLVFFSMHVSLEEAIASSFLLGFIADLAAGIMGPFTICCGLAGSLLSQTQGFFPISRPVYQLTVVFAVTLLVYAFANLLTALKIASPASSPFSVLFFSALY